MDNGLAVFKYSDAWGIIEVPSLEVAPHSRRLEVYLGNVALDLRDRIEDVLDPKSPVSRRHRSLLAGCALSTLA
jgi:hypothetical protein